MKQLIFIFFVDFQLSRSHFGSRNCWLGKPALPKQEQRWQQCCRYGGSFAWCPCVAQRKGWKCMGNLRSWKWNSTEISVVHVSRKVYDFQFKGTAFVLLGDLESLWLDHGPESGSIADCDACMLDLKATFRPESLTVLGLHELQIRIFCSSIGKCTHVACPACSSCKLFFSQVFLRMLSLEPLAAVPDDCTPARAVSVVLQSTPDVQRRRVKAV